MAKAFKASEQVTDLTFEDAPKNLAEAKRRPDWPQFRAAMLEELLQLQAMGTWSKTKLPPQRKAVGHRWVFVIKKNGLGKVVRYNARLVAQGFLQIPSVDYNGSAIRFAENGISASSNQRLGATSYRH